MSRKTVEKSVLHPKVARAGSVALVGRSNVGKSTLMNPLLGQALAITSPIAQTTRHRILGVVRHEDAQIALLDTPGLHKPRSALGKQMNQTARAAVDEADVVCFVTDPDVKQKGDLSVREGDRVLLQDIGAGKPTILVVNKIDLVRPRSRLMPLLGALGELRDFAAVVPIAGQRGDGTDRLLSEIAKLLPAGDAMFEEDELTDRPVRFFVAEFVREQILRKTFQEVPHGVAVVVERFDEPSAKELAKSADAPTRIELAIHVDREAHKGILIGARGAMLKEVGTQARVKVETMLGKHVHLQLWVRVTPKWFESDARLKELGYSGAGPTASTGKEDA